MAIFWHVGSSPTVRTEIQGQRSCPWISVLDDVSKNSPPELRRRRRRQCLRATLQVPPSAHENSKAMETEKLKLRQFSQQDFEQTFNIVKVCFSYPYPPSYLEKFYEQYPEGFTVAECQGKIIAYIPGQIKNDAGHLGSLAVLPDFQKKGIGKTFVNFLIKRFEEKGFKKVTAHVRIKNQKGIAFYEKMGFNIVKTIKKLNPDGEDGYVIEKEI